MITADGGDGNKQVEQDRTPLFSFISGNWRGQPLKGGPCVHNVREMSRRVSEGSASCYTALVRRTLIKCIVFALLALLLTGPAFELVDHWDNIPETGNDTVLSVVQLLTCAGAVFAVRRYTVMAIKLLYLFKYQSTPPLPAIFLTRREVALFELDSGPLPSLSSLRI